MTSASPGSVANLSEWVGQRLVAEHTAIGRQATGRQATDQQGSASKIDDIRLIAGDASPRKYYRVKLDGAEFPNTVIAVESPPTEKNEEFLRIRELLAAGDVRVPALIAADIEQGYLLLEDLGDETLLPHLSDVNVSEWYARGLASLADLARIDPAPASLEAYGAPKLMQEMRLFTDWFVPRLLNLPMSDELEAAFSAVAELLIANAQDQPQVLVHRDFHSRNLMVLPDNELAVIDFQDGVVGPVTYDVVSLLKDCYVRWPRERQLDWLRQYQDLLENSGAMDPVPTPLFVRWFDLMGLQRHIKVLGIFSRLAFRDGKPQYLLDLPRVLAYTREALDLYRSSDEEVATFREVFEAQIVPACQRADWFSSETCS